MRNKIFKSGLSLTLALVLVLSVGVFGGTVSCVIKKIVHFHTKNIGNMKNSSNRKRNKSFRWTVGKT